MASGNDDPNVEMLVGTIQRRAMEIVALPPERREQHYEAIQKAFLFAARQLGADEASAEKQSSKLVEFTRAMVQIIHAGGGSTGGHA